VRDLQPDALIRGNHDKVGSGVESPEGFNAVARNAIRWTYDQLTKENREWLAALPAGPMIVDDVLEICHGTPFDEDAYVFDDLDALRACTPRGARSACSATRTCRWHITSRAISSGLASLEDQRPLTIALDDANRYLVNPGSGRSAARRRSARGLCHRRCDGEGSDAVSSGISDCESSGAHPGRRAA
jgi:hypothetical protein